MTKFTKSCCDVFADLGFERPVDLQGVTVKSLITDEMVEAGTRACRNITFNALTMQQCKDAVRVALAAALSVPCLQEPTLIQHRVHFNEDGCPTGWRSGDGAGAYPDSPILRVEVRKLYAQPIEVREQVVEALRPFSEIAESELIDVADKDEDEFFRHDGSVLTIRDFRRAYAILALLEGR